jgi:uncharacterized phage protein gp47/JayE
MYEDITYEDILDRMLERVPDGMDKREGSLIYDALAPAAVEIQLMYIELDGILREAFADTASRENLIRRAAERGVTPKAAVKAALKGEFTPASLEIPLGSRFSCNGLHYTVQEKTGDGTYVLECETQGTAGNSVFGSLIPVEYIEGLKTAALTELLLPGEEEEDTESIRERYFASFAAQSFGGNVQDYTDKTLAIPGVGAVWVTPVWNGGGTVKLTILDSGHNRASAHLIQKVQQSIDPTQGGDGVGFAPIGHVVTVDTPEEYAVDVEIGIAYEAGHSFASLGSQISQEVAGYLAELREAWQREDSLVVRRAQIESRIIRIAGIVDITHTRLNGKEENIFLDKEHIPVMGVVTA